METECFFCKEKNPIVLEKHHIVPRVLGINSKETITVCRNCHKKIHYIYNILFSYLNLDKKENLKNEEIYESITEIEENKKLVKLVDLIKEVEKEFENEHNQVPCNILREKAKKEGISDEEFDKYIKILKENGIIFNPRKNFIKLV